MRIVESSELSNYKVLPFDIYSEHKSKILEAGEVLTPGKLIMLKNYLRIYAEDLRAEDEVKGKSINVEKSSNNLTNFSYESIDPDDFETVVNRDAYLETEVQVRIKYFFRRIMDLLMKGYYEDSFPKLQSLVNILKNEIFKHIKKIQKGSQVRFMGEYEICHPLNVAVISGLIANRIEYTPRQIDEVILAALLHDIGKMKIKNTSEPPMLTMNEDEVREHTTIGYKLILDSFRLSERIAQVALEHHENNDGSGYPQGLSNDFISEYSQIINVANYYDNLAFNRTHILVTNNREALRALLETGTKKFSAKILYTFIHMFKYDDINDFNDMIL